MRALVAKTSGFAEKRPENTTLKSLKPFIENADIEQRPLKKGQVRIRVKYASVNPSDSLFMQGAYFGQAPESGAPIGFEGVGTVTEAGQGVLPKLLKGRRVAFAVTENGSGSWAEYAIADADTCVPLLPKVSDVDGASMIVNPFTALAIRDIVKQSPSNAFVYNAAASQLGKFLASVTTQANLVGIAVVRRDDQIEDLKARGVKYVLNQKDADFREQLKRVVTKEDPKMFFDAVGGQSSVEIFEGMPFHSRWLNYGLMSDDTPDLKDPSHLIFQRKTIEGFWLKDWLDKTPLWKKMLIINEAQSRFASGEWKTDISAIIPMNEVLKRLPKELAKADGKIFIQP